MPRDTPLERGQAAHQHSRQGSHPRPPLHPKLVLETCNACSSELPTSNHESRVRDVAQSLCTVLCACVH